MPQAAGLIYAALDVAQVAQRSTYTALSVRSLLRLALESVPASRRKQQHLFAPGVNSEIMDTVMSHTSKSFSVDRAQQQARIFRDDEEAQRRVNSLMVTSATVRVPGAPGLGSYAECLQVLCNTGEGLQSFEGALQMLKAG